MNITTARKRFALLAIGCALSSGGCRKQARPEQPPTAATKPARYTFSAGESKIFFVAARATGTCRGSFRTFSGAIVVDNQDLARSSVTVDIDMASLQTDDPQLATQLQAPAFLAAAKYPRARFVSTAVGPGGELGATNTVTGNLELRGVTRSIAIPATVHVRPTDVDVDAELKINRQDFGVGTAGPSNDGTQDQILINLELHATQAP
ncbi:MAG: YceI family protein [Pseudomonadota bacterium]